MDKFLEECKELIGFKYSIFKSELSLLHYRDTGEQVINAYFADSKSNIYSVTKAGEDIVFIVKYKLEDFYLYDIKKEMFFDMKYII